MFRSVLSRRERSPVGDQNADAVDGTPQPVREPTIRPNLTIDSVASGVAVQRITEEEVARKMQARFRAKKIGDAVRQQVSVKREQGATNTITTRIHKPKGGVLPLGNGPAAQIRGHMQGGATYTRMTNIGGAHQGTVIGTQQGGTPQSPAMLAHQAPAGSAFINGGYFVHKGGLLDASDEIIPEQQKGRPVGPTMTRNDHVPIPGPWAGDYGHVMIGGNVGVSSGPLLAMDGEDTKLPLGADRFQYRVGDPKSDNPLNKYAGALTHASDANERAAISVTKNGDGENDHTVMHTLTASQRSEGASMEQWQAITALGARSAQREDGVDNSASTLNLDGGGSIYMGVRTADGIEKVAASEAGGGGIRDVANIVVSKGRN